MKKLIAIIAFGTIGLSSLNSCDTYHSLSNASSISQLSANPFVQNVAKSVIKNLGNTLVQNGIKNAGKLGLNTDLKSILTTAQAVSGFKNMLSSTYGIANNVVDKNYNKLGSLRDVVGMVSTLGTKGLNFYTTK
jgi:hypothetical protein